MARMKSLPLTTDDAEMDRSNLYEAAFEAYLRDRRLLIGPSSSSERRASSTTM